MISLHSAASHFRYNLPSDIQTDLSTIFVEYTRFALPLSKMKSVLAISAFAAAVLAQADSPFGIMSTRSASPVHLLPFTARGGKFFLGGAGPTSYCPPQVEPNCPPGTQTLLVGGTETVSLDVMVPGGQQSAFIPVCRDVKDVTDNVL